MPNSKSRDKHSLKKNYLCSVCWRRPIPKNILSPPSPANEKRFRFHPISSSTILLLFFSLCRFILNCDELNTTEDGFNIILCFSFKLMWEFFKLSVILIQEIVFFFCVLFNSNLLDEKNFLLLLWFLKEKRRNQF